MSDNSEMQFGEVLGKSPSVYRLWQRARAEGGSQGDVEERYRELLEEYGHRKRAMEW